MCIEWEDSVQPNASWVYTEDFKAHSIVKCVSVGWLIHSSNSVKTLAPNIGDVNAIDEQMCGTIRIPHRCITRMRNLSKSKK